jgi:Rrf2 family protein
MRLTRSVGYAVGVLLRIVAEGHGGAMTAAKIARGCRFPPRFLYRVLRRLVSGEILLGTSGPRGGYQLARPAKQINLLEIATAVEGVLDSGTLSPVTAKHASAIRRINDLVEESQAAFADELAGITLDQLSRLVGRTPARAKR